MTNCRLLQRFLTMLVFGLVGACDASSSVDPELVGRWQLQGAPLPIYWDIRADGTYAVSGPGAGAGHQGTFETSSGTWALHSDVWGEDGGAYRWTDRNTFIGTGRLGPGVWLRVGEALVAAQEPVESEPEAQPETMHTWFPPATLSPDEVRFTLNGEFDRPLPENLPELLDAARRLSAGWRVDSVPVSLEYRWIFAPNPAVRGSEVRIYFVSPADGAGEMITVRASGSTRFESRQVNWGKDELPMVFVDLPAALRIARANGLEGPLERALLRTWRPGSEPILAWSLTTRKGGRSVDAGTGTILEGDLTGYIASYNADWDRAAKGLQRLLRQTRRGSGSTGGPIDFGTPGTDSSTPYDDGSAEREAYEQRAAESRAYWGGSAEDYNRIKNGECSSSDNARFGC